MTSYQIQRMRSTRSVSSGSAAARSGPLAAGAEQMTLDTESRIHSAGTRAMVAEAARIRAELCASRGLPPSSACACFPGLCRGGQVVNGRLSNGDRCKAAVPYIEPGSEDTEGGLE